MKQLVRVCCWTHGHVNDLFLNKKQEEKMSAKIPLLKAVCPTCRNDLGENNEIFIKSGQTIFDNGRKIFQCSDGHINIVSAFYGDMINIRVSHDKFENISLKIEDVKDLHCRHDGCQHKISPIDDSILALPSVLKFRTKTRVGDVWDKHQLRPVRSPSITNSGDLDDDGTTKANKARLKSIRKKRHIPIDKLPGKLID